MLPFESELYLHGLGHFHPENVIDNPFLTSLDIGTNDEWILERVGIRRRRTVLSLDYIRETRNRVPTAAVSTYTNAETGERAARLALKRAGLEPPDIGLVIAGGCSPQYTIPAEACTIAARLGLSVPAYDISSACSSFAVQLNQLRATRPEALPDYVLVVNAENTTRTVDYADRKTAVLWGDCTTAAVVSLRKPSRYAVRTTFVESDPSGWEKVTIRTGGHFTQNGPAVQAFAIRKSLAALNKLRASAQRPAELFFIGHQANLLMLRSVCERGEVREDRHLFNVDEYGNCGAAGAPSVLSQNWDRFVAGDEIALVVVGSGLTWGGCLIEVRRP